MISKKKEHHILFIFLSLHLLTWTLVPTFSNLNLPLDTIEALAWGSNLEWGFSKHPPLSAFAVEIVHQIFGSNDWAYYLLSQIFVVSTFFIIFKFSNDFFESKKLALLSVLLLEGIYFYNFTTPEFNVNICQLPFWALSVYYTWKCIKFDNTRDYFFLGIFLGLGILSKYLFIYLAIGIKLLFIYLFFKRKKISIMHIFIPSVVTLLVIVPHLNWLITNEFITISYALQRTGGIGSFFDHLIFPLTFLLKQIIILTPFFLLSFFIIKRFKIKLNLRENKSMFLFFTTILPILMMILTSMILGVKIRTMWMTPFYLFFGTLLLFIFKNNILKNRLVKFITVFLFISIISPILYLGISLTNDNKRTDYPGKEIARLVQNKWDKNFRNDIEIVIGDEWAAGNLSYHLISRPKWTQSLKNSITAAEIKGGVIYTGNPQILKKVCPGIFGEIRPVGFCMIGQR